jgi:hypothetical protein
MATMKARWVKGGVSVVVAVVGEGVEEFRFEGKEDDVGVDAAEDALRDLLARCASRERIWRVASKPSMMGMEMSMRMTRGRREGGVEVEMGGVDS